MAKTLVAKTLVAKTLLANTLIQHSGVYNLFHQAYIHPINTSKLFAGILMILMNIGSKYIDVGLSKTQEQALRNGVGREIVIFCVVFLGTRDLVLSLLMTGAFVILTEHIFNEESRFCIMPHKLKKISAKAEQINKTGEVTPEEEKKAMEVLDKAKQARKKQQQGEFISYMDKYSSQTFADQTFSDQFHM
jgi:hypothetical protein